MGMATLIHEESYQDALINLSHKTYAYTHVRCKACYERGPRVPGVIKHS